MWKRLIIALGTLIGFCSIGHVYGNMHLDAVSAYSVGSSVTIKLGEKGIGPGGAGSMVKGDKVYVGSNTASGNAMSFILLLKETYNTYQPQVDGSGVYSLDTSVPNITGWFAMQNEAYSHPQFFSRYPPAILMSAARDDAYVVLNFLTTEATSTIARELNTVNTNISSKTKSILLPRNLEALQELYDRRSSNLAVAYNYEENLHYALMYPKGMFLGDYPTLASYSGTVHIPNPSTGYHFAAKDLTFSEKYFEAAVISDLNVPSTSPLSIAGISNNGRRDWTICSVSSCSNNRALRLSAEFDLSDVVFATGMGAGSSYSEVKNQSPNLSGSYTDIYTATAGYDKLKLRLLDDTGSHSITFNDIENKNTTTISKAVKDSTIYLDANAPRRRRKP